MGTEFEDALSEITGASNATAPEIQQEQAQAAPVEGNSFEQAIAELQEATPAEKSHDTPEPGGGLER